MNKDWDIELLEAPEIAHLYYDEDGLMGIAAYYTTPKRAAEFLGITQPTLRRYTKMGFLTRYRVGSRRYYCIEELKLAKQNIF